MKKSTRLILIGIIVGLIALTGILVSRNQSVKAARAYHSGASREVSSHHMRIAMVAEVIGVTSLIAGIPFFIAGIVKKIRKN